MSDWWYSPRDLAGLPGMPASRPNVAAKAVREGWQSRPRKGRGGGREYHIDSLPPQTRAALLLQVTREKDFFEPHPSTAEGATVEVEKTSPSTYIEDDGLIPDNSRNCWVPDEPPSDAGERRALARIAILQALERHCETHALKVVDCEYDFAQHYPTGIVLPDWVAETVSRVSRSTLSRWRAEVRRGGLLALRGNYGSTKPSKIKIDESPQIRAFIEGMLVEKPHLSASIVHRALHARFNTLDLPSLPTVRRWIKGWKEKNQQVYVLLRNPDSWKNSYMPSFGRRDATVLAVNDLWELDSTPADLALAERIDPDGSLHGVRRYHLVGAIDVYTRRMKLIVAPTSRATAIATLLRACLLDWGVPQEVKTDNGRDYRSLHIQQVLGSLGIKQTFCTPFTPQEKPFIEAGLGTFNHDLLTLLPGYLGSNVSERQAIRAQQSFAERLRAGADLLEVPLTASQFQDFCNWWCVEYGNRVHGGTGVAPLARAANARVKRIADERALDLLLAEGRSATIQKKGIRLHKRWYIAPELANRIKEVVHLRHSEDAGRVFVFADPYCRQFICVAECADLLGAKQAEIARAAHAATAAQREAVRSLKRAAKAQGIRDLPAEILTAARENAAATVATLSPPVEDSYALPPAVVEALGMFAGMDRGQPTPLTADEQAFAQRLEAEEAERAAREAQAQENPEQWYFRVWKYLNHGVGEAPSEDDLSRWERVNATPQRRRLERLADTYWAFEETAQRRAV